MRLHKVVDLNWHMDNESYEVRAVNKHDAAEKYLEMRFNKDPEVQSVIVNIEGHRIDTWIEAVPSFHSREVTRQ